MANMQRIVKANRNHVKSSISQLLTLRLMTAVPPPPQLKLLSSDPLSLVLATTKTATRRPSNVPFPIRIMCTSTRREKDVRGATATATAKSTFNRRGSPPTPNPIPIRIICTSTNPRERERDSSSELSDGYCNPFFDFFFRVVDPDRDRDAHAPNAPYRYVKRLLPLLWSHNPQTTVKLIFNLGDTESKYYREAFFRAACWLHHNHPKTLARNIKSIALFDIVEILYRLVNEDGRKMPLDIVEKAVEERYERDPDYQLLLELVSDILVDLFKSDIENWSRRLLKRGNDSDHYYISTAAVCCSYFPHVMLRQSIARKFFPRESFPEYQGVSEADYEDRVLYRLTKEVLAPLKAVYDCPKNFHAPQGEASFVVYKYLEEVKAGKTKIVADALLPHEIVSYVHNRNVGEVAELQWTTMVEDIKKQAKNRKKILNNCLAVCDINSTLTKEIPLDVAIALGILVAEQSEEPWKGKVINYNDSPQLHLIQGDDLRSKCDFVRSIYQMSCIPDFPKMFDVILDVAVNENLKPEQMIRKVFVLSHRDFDEVYPSGSWNTHFEAIHCKFKDKGYGDAVPHIVFWTLSDYEPEKPEIPCRQLGMTILRGFSNDLLELFLDNGGDIGPDHVMEAAISGKMCPLLAVVD